MHQPHLLPVIKRGFPPLIAPGARVLVLGSLPGDESIRRNQYYGNDRNAFWPIMAELCGFDAAAAYEDRVAALTAAGVAVWDVLAAADRPGSLDSAITDEVANPIAELVASLPELRAIACNGGSARRLLKRHCPEVEKGAWTIAQLPSTSPAAAKWGFGEKLAAWREFFFTDVRPKK